MTGRRRSFASIPAPFALAASLALIISSGCGRGENEEGEERAERVVTVEATVVEEREWQLVARAVGSLRADEQIQVRNEVGGQIIQIKAREGDWVSQGDVLLRIDDERSDLDVKRAEARFEEMQAQVRRREPLFEQELITEAEMIETRAGFKAAEAELGLMRRRLADTTVRAPIEGQLGRRHVSLGDYIQAGSPLFDLVKLDIIKLDFNLPERYLPLIEIGQNVRVTTAAHPDRTFEGEVYFVDPLINPATRTIAARALIDNADLALRPNQFVNVELDVTMIERAIVIPEEALISDMGGYSVYVIDDDDRADLRRVRLGEREPGYIEIREGVSVSERVVAAGHQRLQPGVRVRDRNQSED